MFNGLLKLRMFILESKFDEMTCSPHNFRCAIFGHEVDESRKNIAKSLAWNTLDDGFRYKQLTAKCNRCNSDLFLWIYEAWPDKVLIQKVCEEKK